MGSWDICGGGGGATCGQCGGRLLLRWWLWEEEGSCVTVCDACDFGSMFECMCVIMVTPKFVVYITCTVL